MSKKVLITGGTGLIGHHLSSALRAKKYEVAILTRGNSHHAHNRYHWDIKENEIDPEAFPYFENIIHLAGAGVADKRWTEKRKQVIIDSRTEGPKFLHQIAEEHHLKVNTFISASGINAYGTKTVDKIFTEDDDFADDFLGRCCELWEQAADQFKASRVVKLRTGLVIAKEDGAYPQIAKPIRWGLGAALGSGKQWMPWIHIDDIVNMYIWALENNISGAYNACTNDHINNKQFTITAAHAIGKKIWLPNIPGFLLKLYLGSRAGIVLEGSRASSQKALDAGFGFGYSELGAALKAVEED